MTNEDITILIPAYNEEKTIYNLVKNVKKTYPNVLVVVAKKSKDNTYNLAKEAGAKVIYDSGEGHGAAKRLGIKEAETPIVVLMDADGSHNPLEIIKLIEPIRKNQADLVVGSRILGGSDELNEPGHHFRYIATAFVVFAINKRFRSNLTDVEDGFRAIKKDVALSLNLDSTDFDIEQEMVMKALKKKYKVMEVPVHEYKREFGESNIKLLKMGHKFVWRLVKELF